MADPQKDEHIEELLSKLQGIFGKLSHSEEEESKQKVELPPAAAPVETPKITPAPPPITEAPRAPVENSAEIPMEPPAATPTPADTGGYVSMAPTGDPEKVLIPTAVFFPHGKESEAKSLAQKLEMMTPKFTKVAFRLQVVLFLQYDRRGDWKDMMMAKAGERGCQTLFVVVDRALDDATKKSSTAEFEAKNIYFQDVPQASIEKKAYYTDILLGLVFFFDSRKPPENAEGA